MPKRSNSFQRLALLIHERLNKSWNVEESYMFSDLITGEPREVDIVAKTMAGPYPIYLSIECRDHARPADIIWIEGVSKKHEHLPTSKLVLWSRNGFTKSALLKAQALKIETVSQAEALNADWAHLARQLIDGHVEHVTPTYTAFVDVISKDGSPHRIENAENAVLFNSSGAQVGSVQQIIHFISSNNETRTVVLDNSKPGQGNFYAELTPPEPWFADISEGGKAQILRVGVGIGTYTEHVAIDTASAISEDKVMTLVSAKLAAGTLEVLIQESPDGTSSYVSKLLPKKN